MDKWTVSKYSTSCLVGKWWDKKRHSVACFAHPAYYTEVSCLKSCCAPSVGMLEARYESIMVGKYILDQLGLMYKPPPPQDDDCNV
eukprot:12817529-Ditylum_brightwellii.AAC.1